MTNSKAKGKRFEREIAKHLTTHTDTEWYRVPGSGMYSTRTGTKETKFKGDVYCDTRDDIVIECKSCKDLKFSTLFRNRSKFYKWIKQCERESGDKKWLLFFKINREGTYMLTREPRMELFQTLFVESNDLLVNGVYTITRLK